MVFKMLIVVFKDHTSLHNGVLLFCSKIMFRSRTVFCGILNINKLL